MLLAKIGAERTPPLEEGVYTGVCTMVIDLGVQYNQMFDKTNQQVKILWNVVGEYIEINDEKLPRQISKDFTLSMDDRSTLHKMLKSWRGKAFTAEELQGFDLRKLLGAGCQLQVIHKSNDRGTFAVVENIMQLPKGAAKPEAESTGFFDMDDAETYAVFDTLPRYIQEKIAQAQNFAATGLVLPAKNGNGNGNGASSYGEPPPEYYPSNLPEPSFEELCNDDDLPF